MRKKEVIWSLKPSGKNKIYLERLGFIDGRSGKVRKEMNLNEFLNHCVTLICEAGMTHRTAQMANSNELLMAWKKYQLGLKARQIAKLQKEIVVIGNMKTETEMRNTAREIIIGVGATEELMGWE